MMTSIPSLKPSATPISPQEFSRLPDPPLLIDVRSRFEYRLGHAPKAVNLSLPRILMGRVPWLQNWVLPQWFRELPKDRPIAVICLTAHRSPMAADALLKSGFQQVFDLTGGMVEWQRLGLPREKS